MFGVRWRWMRQRALAVLRMFNGKKTPPRFCACRVDDLLAACSPRRPDAGERRASDPDSDHPLVQETMRYLFTEAMDYPALEEIVRKISARELTLIAKDTPTPSPLSHEILNSNPYTFLDDAPLEERRARAVMTRRTLSAKDLEAFGALDAESDPRGGRRGGARRPRSGRAARRDAHLGAGAWKRPRPIRGACTSRHCWRIRARRG